VIGKNFKAVEALVKKGAKLDIQDKEGSTALHIAIVNKQMKIVKNLVANGANKEIKDKKGKNALDYAKVSWSQAIKKVVFDEKK